MIRSVLRAKSAGFSGNMKGDGTLLGAVLVMGSREQGIIYQYQAKEFGDHAPFPDIIAAINKIVV